MAKELDHARFREGMDDARMQAVQLLYHSDWAIQKYDFQLREAISLILTSIGATAFLASQRQARVNLYCPRALPRAGPEVHARLRRNAEGVVRRHAEGQQAPGAGWTTPHGASATLLFETGNIAIYELSDSGKTQNIMILSMPRRMGTAGPSVVPGAGAATFAVLVFRLAEVLMRLGWTGGEPTEHEATRLSDEFTTRVCAGLLPMLLDAFGHRERRFAALPPKVAERYWDEAPISADRSKGRDELRACLQPPWDQTRLVKTATLSLDLRKSTYCMEYARSESAFGRWLDHLVKKMKEVAHLHGGVFDKFTGDGALIHFLDRECCAIYGQRAVDAAVHCAVDLQRAIEIHMQVLRRILHHDSPLFGAGIAIDVGKAVWSVDYRDNPVVVGKGVVGACRAGDKAPRRTIRLTNGAYQSLSMKVRDNLSHIRRVCLEAKDTADALKLECWEFSAEQELHLGQGLDAIKRLCREIKEQFDEERKLKKQLTP